MEDVVVHDPGERWHAALLDFDDETTRRFAEECGHEILVRKVADRCTEPTGDAHLGKRNGEAAFAHVVARHDQSRLHGGVKQAIVHRGIGIRCRRHTGIIGLALHEVEMRTSEFGLCGADQHQGVPWSEQVGGHTPIGIGHVADRSDHQSGWNSVSFSVRTDVLVVQGILSGHERSVEHERCSRATVDGRHQVSQSGLATRVAPREIVEQCDLVGVGTDGDDVAHGFVDGVERHSLGIVQPVPRVDPDADRHAVCLRRVGEYNTVGGAVRCGPDQGTNDRRTEDLVVIPVNGGGLRGNVRMTQQRQQRLGRVFDSSRGGAAALRVGQCGVHLALRPSVVQKRRVEFSDLLAVVAHDQHAVAGE